MILKGDGCCYCVQGLNGPKKQDGKKLSALVKNFITNNEIYIDLQRNQT